MRAQTLGLWLLLLGGGCARGRGRPTDADLQAALRASEAVHAGSGLCFATAQGAWRLMGSRAFDNAQGEDRGFNYTRNDVEVLASIYVYPQAFSPQGARTALQEEMAVVAEQVPDVTWQLEGEMTWSLLSLLPQGEASGIFLMGHQTAAPAVGGKEAETLAALWHAPPWSLKLRMTWTPPGVDWQVLTQELLAGIVAPCASTHTPDQKVPSR